MPEPDQGGDPPPGGGRVLSSESTRDPRRVFGPTGIARVLLALASDFESRDATVSVGVLRQAARLLSECRCHATGSEACPRCGAEIVQPTTGRRRRFCSDRCRVATAQESKRHRKTSLSA